MNPREVWARANLRHAQWWLYQQRLAGASAFVVRYHENNVCRCLDELWAAQGGRYAP